jgi:ClpP class serine protease
MHKRLWHAAIGGLWLMEESHVRQILDIIERPRSSDEIRAVEAQLGRPLDNSRTTTMRGSVAVIPITGPIFRYANLFTMLSGATSTEALSLDFAAAMRDPAVEAMLLNIDSPGGEATGINELGDMIASARSSKPVWAYIEGYGASAAYWLASPAERIVMDATAAARLDRRGDGRARPDQGQGRPDRVCHQPVAKQAARPDDRARQDAAADAGRRHGQRVCRQGRAHRGVSAEHVLERFGAGGMLVGRAAVDAGLADALGSFEATLAELAAQGAKPDIRDMRDAGRV